MVESSSFKTEGIQEAKKNINEITVSCHNFNNRRRKKMHQKDKEKENTNEISTLKMLNKYKLQLFA